MNGLLERLAVNPIFTLSEFLDLQDKYEISRYEVVGDCVKVALTNGTNITIDRVNCILSDHIRQEAIA